ncbi:MAG TPA: 30S ribosomal protein S17 [Pyrinomonadaceae bacterium]|jgi:small subunit ribosomal protein S17
MARKKETDLAPGSPDTDVSAATTTGGKLADEVARSADAPAGNAAATATAAETGKRGRRSQKVGIVSSDKMQKTVVVRVDRLVRHQKYRRYVWRTSKFMAHDDKGATVGDKVRIVETRPLSTRKRWRVIEIVQKAAK